MLQGQQQVVSSLRTEAPVPCPCGRTRGDLRDLLKIVKNDCRAQRIGSELFVAYVQEVFLRDAAVECAQWLRTIAHDPDSAKCISGFPVSAHPAPRRTCLHIRTEVIFCLFPVGAACAGACVWILVAQDPDGPIGRALTGIATALTVGAVATLLRGPWDCCLHSEGGAIKTLAVFAPGGMTLAGATCLAAGCFGGFAVLQAVGVALLGGVSAAGWPATLCAWKRQRYDRTTINGHVKSLVRNGSKTRLCVALVGHSLYLVALLVCVCYETGARFRDNLAVHVLCYIGFVVHVLGFFRVAYELWGWSKSEDLVAFLRAEQQGTVCGFPLFATASKPLAAPTDQASINLPYPGVQPDVRINPCRDSGQGGRTE